MEAQLYQITGDKTNRYPGQFAIEDCIHKCRHILWPDTAWIDDRKQNGTIYCNHSGNYGEKEIYSIFYVLGNGKTMHKSHLILVPV